MVDCVCVCVELFCAGKEILDRRYEMIKDDIARGTVDETKAVGELNLDFGKVILVSHLGSYIRCGLPIQRRGTQSS